MKFWRKPFDQADNTARPAMVVINSDRCKGCSYCVEFCPTGALAMSQEMNTKGYLLPNIAESCMCLGCGLCEALCPDFAIHVILSPNEVTPDHELDND